MTFKWFRDRADAGSKELRGHAVIEAFNAAGIQLAHVHDLNYLALEQAVLKDAVYRWHDPRFLVYHGNSDEFPDCDDFAVCARADIVHGAAKSGLKYPPVFGECSIQRKGSSGPHMLNAAITAEGKLLLYEPQSGKWPADFSDVDQFMSVRL